MDRDEEIEKKDKVIEEIKKSVINIKIFLRIILSLAVNKCCFEDNISIKKFKIVP